MRTQAQAEASRINGAKSRGPVTAPGKEKVKFNGVKHGLRAEHVVLPGENAADFEAERRAWIDDWRPKSHTRAVLCERAAEATWRLRRSVRVEAARMRRLAGAAAIAFDAATKALVDRALEMFDGDAAGAVELLETDPAGVDQLLAWWADLERALAGGPGGWDSGDYHARLMVLLGHDGEADPAECGPMLVTSLGLLAANAPEEAGDGAVPLGPDEAEEAAADLLALVAEARGELLAVRARYVDSATLRRRSIDAALVDDSAEARLLHRYEMAHDRSLRATVAQLMALEKSGADLAGLAEDEAEALAESSVASPEAAAPTEPGPSKAAAPSEPEPGESSGPPAPSEPEPEGYPTPSGKAGRDRDGRIWAVATPGGGDSPG